MIALKARTRQSRIEIAEAARTRVYRGAEELEVTRSTYQSEDYIQQVLAFDAGRGQRPYGWRSWPPLYSSRDRGISEPLEAAVRSASRYPTFETALDGHARAWDELWEVCDAQLPREERVQFLLRFHTAHLLQVCSRQTAHHDAGVPARGLNGEAYRGHVFWDELFVYPFLNFRLPLSHARAARCTATGGSPRRARRHARAGFEGAMYPWQSGSDGQEQTQTVHLNPLSGQWEPDLSRNQRHVSAAIFYTVWHYHQATHDFDFLRDCGAEMMLEIARFWSSDRALQPGARSVGDPRRHGPGRVPREVSGRGRGGPAQQRVHERHGGLDLRDRAARSWSSCRRAAETPCGRRIGLTDEEIQHVAGDEPQDVRAVPRRRGDQPVRGL